jgi:hypothetical protein
MKPGTQIAYVPTHADGIDHPDVEFGFVTSQWLHGEAHYCRYWRKGHLGELRTVANSELAPDDCLVVYTSVNQSLVDRWLEDNRATKRVLSRFLGPK